LVKIGSGNNGVADSNGSDSGSNGFDKDSGDEKPPSKRLGSGDMKLANVIQALIDHSRGSGLTGAVNIESGHLEFSAHPPGYSCASCADEPRFTVMCDTCGRRPGNNVSFLAGSGDGVYASVGFFAKTGIKMIAAVWILDDGNGFASATLPAVQSGFEGMDVAADLLVPALERYWNLSGEVIGEIDASDSALIVADRGMTIFEDALVSFPFSQGGTYKIVLFGEPVLLSESVGTALALGGDENSFTGGFPGSLLARVAIAVESSLADEIFPPLQDQPAGHDWDAQWAAWNTMLVNSNLAASNGPTAALNNGYLWLRFLEQQPPGSLEGLALIYVQECFGWFVQAACEGDEEAKEQVRALNARYDKKLVEPSFLSDVAAFRGFVLTPEVQEFISNLTEP